jgi:hypothetical protein
VKKPKDGLNVMCTSYSEHPIITRLLAKADMTALYSLENLKMISRGTRGSSTPLDSASKPSDNISSKPAPTVLEQTVVLSPEQNIIFARAKEGKNIFFTGSAGK